ncbi:MAG: leucyl/phenylalanyl-tRNA--protein transferase [Phycisphaerales bacterium]|nr:leucyl/phenylalanyl-tRNA--protein transferase [Phycisphaerales bacterium]
MTIDLNTPAGLAEAMLRGYAAGAFAMGHPDGTIEWFDPDPRAILGPQGVHVSRSLQRVVDGRFDIRLDTDPTAVMVACSERAQGREDTWLTPVFMAAVERLIADGWVHSVEAWRDGALVGGVYGIHMNGVFFAESMFSQPPAGTDASKVCLVHLERHLRARGIGLLDCQFLTPHLERMGFIEVPRSVWRGRLHDALLTPVAWED